LQFGIINLLNKFMTVCFFGNYIKDYPRIQTMRKGLNINNINVLECHTRKRGIKKYLDLFKQHRKIKNNYDILIVTMGGYTLVWFAKLISNKRIIFDVFTSLYLTNIEDRKTCSKYNLKAIYYKLLDKYSCKLANSVLLDTDAQINYFCKKYRLQKRKFKRIFISTDNDIYYSKDNKKDKDKFIIHWHGHIVPLHSIETIIKSAKLLEDHKDIVFQIVTRFNSKYRKIKKLVEELKLKNIKFYSETDYKGLDKFINQSNICLGIFGDNKKAELVIPNKIIESIACSRPVITANHEVLKELFTENKDIILVDINNPKDLVNKILELKNNKGLQDIISKNCYNLFLNKLRPEIIVKDLIKIL